MNDACPGCHTPFEREPGYFVGAMYISYAMAVSIPRILWIHLDRRLDPGR